MENNIPVRNAAAGFSTLGATPYRQVLPRVQQGVVESLSRKVDELTERELKSIIAQYIRNNNIKCDLSADVDVLVEHIYHDMAGYSFISREGLFERPGFEELNINSWDAVEIVLYGRRAMTGYSFLSPQHARDILARILRRT